MRIEVNHAKREKAEAKKYTNKGMVRVRSDYEREHVMIQVNVCGLVSDAAEMVVSKIVAKLGLDDSCLLSHSSVVGNGGQYDDARMVYTDWLCIDKTAANGSYDEVRSAVRAAAKKVKAETKKNMFDESGMYFQTTLV